MAGLETHLKAIGDPIRPGQRVSEVLTAERINGLMGAIWALVRGDNIYTGPGSNMRKRSVGNGFILIGDKRYQTSATPASLCPLDISVDDLGTGNSKITFRAGTINQLLPSNYLTGIIVSNTGTFYLQLDLTAANGKITAASFSAQATPPNAIAPIAGTPPTSFSVLVGVLIGGFAIKVWGCGNIQALPQEAFRLQKVTPVAGQVPYDVYYTWNVTKV